jgi:hypothetical protein
VDDSGWVVKSVDVEVSVVLVVVDVPVSVTEVSVEDVVVVLVEISATSVEALVLVTVTVVADRIDASFESKGDSVWVTVESIRVGWVQRLHKFGQFFWTTGPRIAEVHNASFSAPLGHVGSSSTKTAQFMEPVAVVGAAVGGIVDAEATVAADVVVLTCVVVVFVSVAVLVLVVEGWAVVFLEAIIDVSVTADDSRGTVVSSTIVLSDSVVACAPVVDISVARLLPEESTKPSPSL